MFDTGFGGSIVLGSNINVGTPTGKMTLRDFVGEFEASTVPLKSLSIGGFKANPSEKEIVMQPDDYSFSYGTHVDAILGIEPFLDSITEINFEKSQFIFHPKSLDISARSPDGKKTFLSRMLPIGGNSIEMAATVSTGKRLTLALDTGNGFYATTHKDSLERVGLWPENKKPKYFFSAGVASGSVDTWYYRMKNCQIYGVPVPESTWDIIDLPSSTAEHDGTIGYQFLKNFNITIDFGRRRVWLDNFSGQLADEHSAGVGLRAGYSYERKRTIIFAVSPESPAELAGIKVGDQLLSINGIELLEGTMERVDSLLRGQPGSKVKLAVSRGGELKRYELERKELLNE
jgi:hypothetical protein